MYATMYRMHTTEDAQRAARRYMSARGIQGSTLCRLATGNSTVWVRLPTGNVTVRTIAKLMRYLSDNWPEALEWPQDVPRPAPSGKEGA